MQVSNSRFIATIAPAFSVQEARAFIQEIEDEFSDASHNVPAFVIGHGATTIAHCNDDGEPAGTAGQPMLAVLQGSEMGDAVVVATRYFGGTKLGKGGLVRAYSDAVREVLAAVPLAHKVATYTVMAAIPYPLFEQVRGLVKSHHGQMLGETFGVDVTITAQFALEDFPPFQEALIELSHGEVRAMIIEEDNATIMPL